MNGNVETRSYLEKKLVFCFGSFVAAQLLLPFGEENFLSNSELKQAQEVGNILYFSVVLHQIYIDISDNTQIDIYTYNMSLSA